MFELTSKTENELSSINYFSRPEISNSDIKLLNKSIAHYLRKEKNVSTEAMNFGSAFHSFVLESEKFKADYIIKPDDIKFTTKEGKLWKEQNADKLIISNADYEVILSMFNSLIEHPLYDLYLNTADIKSYEVEKEIYFSYDGIECRSKLDFINHDIYTIIDLKTIADGLKAEKTMFWDYASQAKFYQNAMYVKTGKIYTVIFIFIEKSNPYGVKFCEAGKNLLERGESEILLGLNTYRNYLANPTMFTGYNADLIYVN